MSQQLNGHVLTLRAAADLAEDRLVALDANGEAVYTAADTANTAIVGKTRTNCLDGDLIGIETRGTRGTMKLTAAAAIAAEATVYLAADGKVDDTGTIAVGTALHAVTGDGSKVEVLLFFNGPIA